MMLSDIYSTTRHIFPVDKKHDYPQHSGGLRTKGYYKKSLQASPLVSVITVVFNAQAQIGTTIKSVINQTYDNVEFIIIDGGSQDGTLKVIQHYEDQIDYWVSEPDRGIYDAMNKGIEMISGDYVIFLNAADTFASETVLSQVAEVINDKKPDVIYGGARVFSENGDYLSELKPLEFNTKNLTLFATRTVCHQSIFVKREKVPLYNLAYALKGELNWYYDIVKTKDISLYKSDVVICNYFLGGVGDKMFWKNLYERGVVVIRNQGLSIFFLSLPFFMIPLLFRFKRYIQHVFR